MAKLKVFRLTIGFHDVYVAAPSQKAAIAAWGSDQDVFQRGQAELVTDPELTEEPLARPGEVIKRLRATAAEQVAALRGEAPPAKRRDDGKSSARAAPKPKTKPSRLKPRPSRAALEKAEGELAEAEVRHEAERQALADREAALVRERTALVQKQEGERERIEARRAKAEAAYERAMRRWRESSAR